MDSLDSSDADAVRRTLVKLNMHFITKEMTAPHLLPFMPSMAGKKLALLYAPKL